jgi:hypothetical protein
MNIQLLTPEQALNGWPTIAPLLIRARDTGQGESSMTDYMQKILNGLAQCWVIGDDNDNMIGAGLTEILNYSQHKTLHIILLAGIGFEELAKGLPVVEQFAKTQGCVAVESWGRKGWTRVLAKHCPGFTEVYTVMRKHIGEDT